MLGFWLIVGFCEPTFGKAVVVNVLCGFLIGPYWAWMELEKMQKMQNIIADFIFVWRQAENNREKNE